MTILPYLTSIPRPVVALLFLAIYGAIVRWRFAPPMLVDIALLGLLIYRPSLGLLAWVACLMIVRHTPALSADVAALLGLDAFDGWTARLVVFALPALRSLMVSEEDAAQKNGAVSVHVLRPETAGSLDTGAIRPNDDETMRDQFLILMADQRDERGGNLFSANQIHAAIGGHRATVLAKVRDRRSNTLPAAFRQSDGTTAPAEYPVTSQKAAP